LTSTTNITTGTISSGTITGRTGTTFTAPTITTSSNLLYGSTNTNVGTKISSIETSLNTKQATLASTTNITTGTISCRNITGRDTATFSAQTIKAGTNLLYGTTNNDTKIEELQTALNETVKLTSANTFTGLQTINGDLNAINTTFTGLTTCTNFTSPNGFIYTLEADTATFLGCITDSFATLEAEIETLVITKRISVDYNNNIQPTAANDLTTRSYVDNLVSS